VNWYKSAMFIFAPYCDVGDKFEERCSIVTDFLCFGTAGLLS